MYHQAPENARKTGWPRRRSGGGLVHCRALSDRPEDLVPWPPKPSAGPDPSEGALAPGRPLGVYVHVPFCSARCPYCDFAIDVRRQIPHERYAEAVIRELEAKASWFQAADAGPLVSLYFGGGTPALWAPEAIARVVRAVARAFGLSDQAVQALEVTIEANPGEIDASGLDALRRAGANRVSFGIQAFDGELLRALGRTHSVAQAREVVGLARRAGFARVACDLMFGVPHQTPALWAESLTQMVALGPDHVSCYALTVEPFTPFGHQEKRGELRRPDDDQVADLFEQAQEALAGAGYRHYEVSSYARPGAEAVHNTLYWTQGAYLGLGCAAASFRPLAAGGGFRFINPRATETYLRAAAAMNGRVAPAKGEWRPPEALEEEAVWLALRTAQGLDRRLHALRFGSDPLASPARAQVAAGLVSAGWLTVTDLVVAPTARGLMFADELATRLWG